VLYPVLLFQMFNTDFDILMDCCRCSSEYLHEFRWFIYHYSFYWKCKIISLLGSTYSIANTSTKCETRI